MGSKCPGNLRTFDMAIQHKRRTTRTELESFLSVDLFSLTLKIFLWLCWGGGIASNRNPPLNDLQSITVTVTCAVTACVAYVWYTA